MSVFAQPRFHNEPEAFKYLESIVWADGVVCQCDEDEARFDERVRKLVKHKPVEKPE